MGFRATPGGVCLSHQCYPSNQLQENTLNPVMALARPVFFPLLTLSSIEPWFPFSSSACPAMFGSSGYILSPVSCDYHECHMGHMAGNRSLDTTQNNVGVKLALVSRSDHCNNADCVNKNKTRLRQRKINMLRVIAM
ncbi:hypothetical protein RRG08_018034 [Elysia crispata]|uniref:Uncharacterized protein n=1 Tax=Elysia crispata TaxID=231223 RepID=A0AAE0ZDA3_9GAST|nr:hypothetical protein RRG08_018034 [Elysia crispata]